MLDFEGKTVLVTGSTRGIGRAIVEEFAKRGANIVVSGTVEEKAQEVASLLAQNYGVKTLGVGMDVSNPQSVEEAFKKIHFTFEGIDILVNNAGITRDSLFLRMKLEDWQKVLDVNLTGTFLVTKQVIRYMTKKRWGRIINITSVVGFTGNVGQVNYSTTKAGLVGFTKSLAKELALRNILVNAVAPGFIETDMTETLKEEIKGEYKKMIPLGRFGTPQEVARVVLFLASPMADYITGEVIHVNGGMY
ncbi:MAG TPA: 3-oxoacyl-[acyl-carrier-protein] reductase [Aquifex aeolicus]|uniref:3-oxoacyl-[acyl-carrier-protein] reductase n=1 Tax=Aquifex aeolicus TaxID=63363 RepID=A0A9D1CEU2_AQUAO|nr:3-oxoacyl-[acyl-carrier-protein] reductase [Aquifex aeolicus]